MGQDYIPLQTKDKKQKYAHLLHQLKDRLDPANHIESNRSNVLALLRAQFNWWWIGYYFVSNKEYPRLVLGSFQGPPACTNIFKGKGVCGTCWELNKTIVVKNVNQFQGHIACSSKSLSQIVVPIRRDGQFVGLLDIDAVNEAEFDEIDQIQLQNIIKIMEQLKLFEDWK